LGQKLQTEHKWGQDFQTIKQQGSEISVLNEQKGLEISDTYLS